MLKRTVLVACALALLATFGCASRVNKVVVPEEPAGIVGTISSVDAAGDGGGFGSILVEGGKQPDGAVSDKAVVTITEETLIARNGRRVPPEELKAGMTVRVWFTGAVAESYPVQGTAKFIEIQ